MAPPSRVNNKDSKIELTKHDVTAMFNTGQDKQQKQDLTSVFML